MALSFKQASTMCAYQSKYSLSTMFQGLSGTRQCHNLPLFSESKAGSKMSNHFVEWHSRLVAILNIMSHSLCRPDPDITERSILYVFIQKQIQWYSVGLTPRKVCIGLQRRSGHCSMPKKPKRTLQTAQCYGKGHWIFSLPFWKPFVCSFRVRKKSCHAPKSC